MFINDFDPVAFAIFNLEIRWYSLSYIFGIIFGWTYCKKKLIKNKVIQKLFDDYIFYLIIGIILGGRIGYVFIYNSSYYLSNISEIIKIWEGGMSFHGAVLGIIIATYLFSKKHKISIFYLLDLVALSSPIGIFFGRIANFINSELYGLAANVPWAVKFVKVDDIYRHPSQLYEALFEGIILFFILLIFYQKGYIKIKGFLSSLFLIFYSVFRFVIEFFRAPDEQIGYLFFKLSMGQLISFLFFSIGLYLLFVKYEFKKK